MAPARVNYDLIAPLYDRQPYREKSVDPHLITFLQHQFTRPLETLAILDIACGTGNQLVANQEVIGSGVGVGFDLFWGMLRQAQPKSGRISWIQADGSHPPFADQTFDFISHQFAFHHVSDKATMMQAVYRLLKPGGRFVMTNIAPHNMSDWIYYQYFPAAFDSDCRDFLPQKTLRELAHEAGLGQVKIEIEHLRFEQDLRDFYNTVRRRDTCSQLLTISDADYQAGLAQLELELTGRRANRVPVHMSLLTLQGDRSE